MTLGSTGTGTGTGRRWAAGTTDVMAKNGKLHRRVKCGAVADTSDACGAAR